MRPVGEPRPVGPDQQLAVGVGPRADADGRDPQLRRSPAGGLRGHHLDHDRERARVFDRVGVRQELLG